MTRSREPRSSLPLLERSVLALFAHAGPVTRADIAQRTGLSRAVVSGLVASLVTRGELVPVDEAAGTGRRGRPSLAYRRAALTPPVALVRLRHHQHTSVSLVANGGTAATSDALPPWSSPWPAWSPAVAQAVAALEAADGPARQVVVATPFPVRDGHGAAPLRATGTMPDWLTEDPRPAIAELLGRPVVLVNDANLAALGEAHYGAGRGRPHVLHLSVRDGIGAGLIFDGKLHTGANGMAGELAHVQVVDHGPFCVCGNRGCLATQTLDPLVVEALTSRYARPLTADDVEQLVRRGDPVAVRFFTDLGALVGRPVATIVTAFDPDVVVVDAQLGAAVGPFIAGLRATIASRCSPALSAGVDIRPGELADPVIHGALAAADAAVTAD